MDARDNIANMSVFSFQNAPHSRQTRQPQTSEMRNTTQYQRQLQQSLKKKTERRFVAYLDERDEKGNLLNVTTPMQQMVIKLDCKLGQIERVRERKYQQNTASWTTERSLRETRKAAITKIQRALKASNQSSFAVKNFSTAENSVDLQNNLFNSSKGVTNTGVTRENSAEITSPESQNIAKFRSQNHSPMLPRRQQQNQSFRVMSKSKEEYSKLGEARLNTTHKTEGPLE